MDRDVISADLFGIFKSSANIAPDRIALETPTATLSYQLLYERALGCASTLAEQLQGEHEIVGILGRKNEYLILGILGSLASGRAYLVLNPKFPLNRILQMRTTAGCEAVIVCPDALDFAAEMAKVNSQIQFFVFQESDRKILVEKFEKISVSVLKESAPKNFGRPGPHQLAYVCFTSGSTGTPKGVMIRQDSVAQYTANILNLWPIERGLRFSIFQEMTFDLTVHDFYVCWATGGTACIPPEDATMAPHRFISESRINCWMSVPSVVTLMSRLKALKPQSMPDLRFSFFLGEALYERHVSEWQSAAPNSRVINLYGPTEATVAISYYECERGRNPKSYNGIISIGHVFDNQHSLLLPVEGMANDEGELCLGGSQLAVGYINDAEKTKEKFIEIPGESEPRFYRTGDLFKKDREGDLFFLGRVDQQVKVKGYRVELPEIDFALRKVLQSDQVATVACDIEGSGSKELVTYVGTFAGLTPKQIQNLLAKELPDYMIPSKLILLESFPLNSSGKIDRVQLKMMAEKARA